MNAILDIWNETLRLLTFQPRPRAVPHPERDAVPVDRDLNQRESQQR